MNEYKPNKTGFIKADDFDIYYEYFGEGKKEAVCLLNGIAMHTKSWYSMLDNVINEYDVLLYDYPGQGQSSSPDVEYDIVRICDYLTMILDELEIERIHIAGISYGGFVAFEYARLYQERLYTCTVSGAMLTYEKLYDMNRFNSKTILENAPFEIFPNILYERIFSENFFGVVEPMLEKMKQKFFDRYKDRVHCLIRLIDTQTQYLDNCLNKQDEYKKIEIPIILMCGDEDLLIPAWVQQKTAEIWPNCKFILVENSGHVVYIEKPHVYFGNMKKLMKKKAINFKPIKK
jgi:pimeloyl-ACP methyl ester carboxylesterase